MDFTTSRLADISFAWRKEAAGRAGATEQLRGEEEREPAAVGGGSCAPVPRLSVPQRVSLSQLRAWLSGLPVPDSTFPAFPRSWGFISAERPAAGGSSKLSDSRQRALAAAAHVLQAHGFLRAFVSVHSLQTHGFQSPPSKRLKGKCVTREIA